MKITELYFERVSNLGNYEAARLGARCILADDEKPEIVFEGLKTFVENQLFG